MMQKRPAKRAKVGKSASESMDSRNLALGGYDQRSLTADETQGLLWSIRIPVRLILSLLEAWGRSSKKSLLTVLNFDLALRIERTSQTENIDEQLAQYAALATEPEKKSLTPKVMLRLLDFDDRKSALVQARLLADLCWILPELVEQIPLEGDGDIGSRGDPRAEAQISSKQLMSALAGLDPLADLYLDKPVGSNGLQLIPWYRNSMTTFLMEIPFIVSPSSSGTVEERHNIEDALSRNSAQYTDGISEIPFSILSGFLRRLSSTDHSKFIMRYRVLHTATQSTKEPTAVLTFETPERNGEIFCSQSTWLFSCAETDAPLPQNPFRDYAFWDRPRRYKNASIRWMRAAQSNETTSVYQGKGANFTTVYNNTFSLERVSLLVGSLVSASTFSLMFCTSETTMPLFWILSPDGERSFEVLLAPIVSEDETQDSE